MASPRRRSTATRARASASARSTTSRPAGRRSSSRRMSPRAGSTSTPCRTSSTSSCRWSPRTTSTGSAGRAGPGWTATPISLVCVDESTLLREIEALLRHEDPGRGRSRASSPTARSGPSRSGSSPGVPVLEPADPSIADRCRPIVPGRRPIARARRTAGSRRHPGRAPSSARVEDDRTDRGRRVRAPVVRARSAIRTVRVRTHPGRTVNARTALDRMSPGSRPGDRSRRCRANGWHGPRTTATTAAIATSAGPADPTPAGPLTRPPPLGRSAAVVASSRSSETASRASAHSAWSPTIAAPQPPGPSGPAGSSR